MMTHPPLPRERKGDKVLIPQRKYRTARWINVVLFLLVVAMGGVYYQAATGFKVKLLRHLTNTSVAINDIIDRNLFERYGDAQAFGINAATHNPENWKKPLETNPLIVAMNRYTALYGVYKLMLFVDLDGNVLAVNSRDANGKPIDTLPVYKQNFAKEPWFTKVKEGQFLSGRNSYTGTVVEQPSYSSLLSNLYGGDGYSLIFAAPVLDNTGKKLGIWANYLDFSVVETIAKSSYDILMQAGFLTPEITILGDSGKVIAHFSPYTISRSKYKRDAAIIDKANLVDEAFQPALEAAKGNKGCIDTVRKTDNASTLTGYSRSVGAYDYAGLGWSVLVTVPTREVFSSNHGPVYRFLAEMFLESHHMKRPSKT